MKQKHGTMRVVTLVLLGCKECQTCSHFTQQTMDCMIFVPCNMAKAKRAPIDASHEFATAPIDLIHIDISGPAQPSIAGNVYTLSILDSYTSRSDVFFLKFKSDLGRTLIHYNILSENETGHRLKKSRLDRAGENISETVKSFCYSHGINL